MFGNSLVSFLLQLLVLSAIPFLVFVIRTRKLKGFLHWIGLRRAPLPVVLLSAAIAAVLATTMTLLMRSILEESGTVSGKMLSAYEQDGWSGWLIGTILVVAWLQTALTEEIFFRGFVGARLISWLGFNWGNAVQSILFGSIHLAMVAVLPAELRTVSVTAVMMVGPTVGAWVMGYMNHRKAGGSILPGWTMHGVGNTIAYTLPLLMA